MSHLKKLFFLVFLFATTSAHATTDSVVQFQIFIADTAYNPVVTPGSPYATVTFSQSGLNAIVGGYNIYNFQRSYISRHPYLQKFWTVTVNSASLMSDLLNYDTTVFMGGTIVSPSKVLWTTKPNDFGIPSSSDSGELTFVNTQTAWAITHGWPGMILGYTDQWVDIGNPDISGKFVKLNHNDTNVLFRPAGNHGVAVGGLLAAATDNGQLTSAICADCKLNFSGLDPFKSAYDTIGHMSIVDQTSVINLSWYDNCSFTVPSPFDANQMYLDELYENATTICASSGDGQSDRCNSIFHYDYPSSYNHVISVGGVGWDQTPGATQNVADVIEKYPGDSSSANTVNDRINIYAPAFGVHVLASHAHSKPSSGYWYEVADGTSLASPMVASTLGLMITVNNALSPYQRQYILDQTANTNMFSIAANAPYSGKMGYGRLDVGAAVTMADPNSHMFNVNAPATQTLTIDGVDLNTICAPGVVSGLAPHLKAIVRNGTPPYTYEWHELLNNTVTLSNYDQDTTTIISASGSSNTYFTNFYLVVKDNSSPPQIAGRHIQIQLNWGQLTPLWDLVSRDTYLDMGDEPNSQIAVDPIEWGVWNGPDIWNRRHKDDSVLHQNPEYFIDSPNYVYVRVRNIGCAASPPNAPLVNKKVQLYWTLQSTGEKWGADWISTSTFGGFTAGGEITSAGPITLGAIEPGHDTIISHPWFPPRPEQWGASLHSVDVCLLSRIVDEHNPTGYNGMTFNEGTSVKANFVNNNNIATRNLTVNNLFPGNLSKHLLLIGNTDATVAHPFNFAISSDKAAHKNFAVDLPALISSIKVTFQSATLFNDWENAGSLGNYTSKNEGDYSVTFSPVSDLMHIDHLSLGANAKEGLIVEISVDSAALTIENAPQYLYFDQYQLDAINADQYHTGEVVYQMNISNTALAKRSLAKTPIKALIPGMFGIYPNPTTGICTLIAGNYKDVASITVADMLGKTVINTVYNFSASRKTELNLSALPSGIYTVRIQGKGVSDVIKVAKE